VTAAGAGLMASFLLVAGPNGAVGLDDERGHPVRSIEDAESLLRGCRSAEAAEAFSAILAARPADERALAGRIEAWIDSDRWVDALSEVSRLGDRVESSGPLASAAGATLYRAGRIDEARRVIERHATPTALSARGLSVLGAVRLAEGRGEEAIEWMRRALEADPGDARVVLRAAEATNSRTEAAERLARYLAIAERDDPDRREGARGTLGWLRVLADRRIWQPVSSRPMRVELALIPVVGASAEPAGWTVTARLGASRRKVRLLLDTGSGGLFLVDRVARRAGFEALGEETTFGGGGSGRHRSARGIVPQVAFGELAFEDALVTTNAEDLDPTGRYQGILGPGVFEGYRVTIDPGRRTLTLVQDGERLAAGAPYWVVAGQILVRAAARGAPDGLFLLDTGATSSVLGLAYVASVPGARMIDRAATQGYGGAIAGARRVEGVELELLGHGTGRVPLIAADLAARSRLGGVEIAGYLGLDLLRGRVLVIDPASRLVDLR